MNTSVPPQNNTRPPPNLTPAEREQWYYRRHLDEFTYYTPCSNEEGPSKTAIAYHRSDVGMEEGITIHNPQVVRAYNRKKSDALFCRRVEHLLGLHLTSRTTKSAAATQAVVNSDAARQPKVVDDQPTRESQSTASLPTQCTLDPPRPSVAPLSVGSICQRPPTTTQAPQHADQSAGSGKPATSLLSRRAKSSTHLAPLVMIDKDVPNPADEETRTASPSPVNGQFKKFDIVPPAAGVKRLCQGELVGIMRHDAKRPRLSKSAQIETDDGQDTVDSQTEPMIQEEQLQRKSAIQGEQSQKADFFYPSSTAQASDTLAPMVARQAQPIRAPFGLPGWSPQGLGQLGIRPFAPRSNMNNDNSSAINHANPCVNSHTTPLYNAAATAKALLQRHVLTPHPRTQSVLPPMMRRTDTTSIAHLRVQAYTFASARAMAYHPIMNQSVPMTTAKPNPYLATSVHPQPLPDLGAISTSMGQTPQQLNAIRMQPRPPRTILPPIPLHVLAIANTVRRLPRNRLTGMPARKQLGVPHLRQNFYERGFLRPTSELMKYKGDPRLFSSDEWTFLLEYKNGDSYDQAPKTDDTMRRTACSGEE